MTKMAAVVAALVVGATLGVGLVIVLGRQADPQVSTSPATAAATSEATSEAASEAAVPADTSSPEAASVAKPVRVVIPAIDVDADLVALGLNDDGSMEVPDFGLAGWYEPGPRPGDPGPAVIAAHVDSVRGPDVFFRLRDLTTGDKITVEYANGSDTTFVVSGSEQQLKDDLPVERIWNDTDNAVLRLITCGGEFDADARSYLSNLIVYAAAA
jgi:sortase (surface protein transpeptidase)